MPIEVLKLEGKEPYPLDVDEEDDAYDPQLHDADMTVYGWEVGEHLSDPRQIPAGVVSCLPGIIQPTSRMIAGKIRTFVVWASRPSARDALATGCLRYARSKAGLPDMLVTTS